MSAQLSSPDRADFASDDMEGWEFSGDKSRARLAKTRGGRLAFTVRFNSSCSSGRRKQKESGESRPNETKFGSRGAGTKTRLECVR
jgi:hypothetical protein